ncbi:MAG: autotransporter outer membrane beta-barrel domain-containing protein [Puniceicoccales bacterium]|nr:autotransporter outer membrane beta-barrel domain-containing protein [Puniceicoccales bacterium]
MWFRVNYNHIAQDGYYETTTAAVGAQHVSAVNHNLFTTILGLNVEKEIFDQEHADKKWSLSLKACWECQSRQRHSSATATFDNNFNIGTIVPILRYPSKHSAIGTLAVSKHLNVNWDIVGSYTGRIGKNISTHTIFCGLKYSF